MNLISHTHTLYDVRHCITLYQCVLSNYLISEIPRLCHAVQMYIFISI